MREYIKIKLHIKDHQAYQKIIERHNGFLFSLNLLIKFKETYQANIVEQYEDTILLEIDGRYQIGTEIPLSRLNTNTTIYVVNITNRKLTSPAEAIVLERYFQAATKENSVEKIKELNSSNTKKVSLNLKFTTEEFAWIKLGRIPKSMDIKWHIYYENNTLHFLRARTNMEIFRVPVYKQNDFYITKEVSFNTEIENFNQINLLKDLLKHMAKIGKQVFDS
jgi:hypothetical protein